MFPLNLGVARPERGIRYQYEIDRLGIALVPFFLILQLVL